MAVQRTEAEKLAQVLERVRNLLARADHPNTPGPEAEVARQQAEALMFRYRIDAAQTEKDEASLVTPSWRDIVVCREASEFADNYRDIAATVLHHFDCRGVTRRQYDHDTGDYMIVIHAVGFEADLQFVDLILTDCIRAFGYYLEPQYDSRQSLEENALRMRKGGMERNRIAAVLLDGWDTFEEKKRKCQQVTRLIKKAAAARGEDVSDVMGHGIKTYRKTFAQSFTWTLNGRLRTMAAARSEEGSLVLANRAERVAEALYERFPHLRPKPDAQAIGTYKDPREGCAKCERAASGYCRDHQWLKPSTAKPRHQSWSAAGYERGAAAARTVDLGSHGKNYLEG